MYTWTHISAGIFETGTLLGCLRKIQGWNLSSIPLRLVGSEMCIRDRVYRGAFAYSFLQLQMFDTDLITMPPTEFVPDWLLPSQQFYVDESERSDSTSHGHSD